MAFRIVEGDDRGFDDVARFVALINALDTHPLPEARRLFAADSEIVVARAPGRLDVMGGIADYSGSLVLQLPIREATLAACQRTPDPVLRVVSLSDDGGDRSPAFALPVSDLAGGDYASAHRSLTEHEKTAWAAYPLGVVPVLAAERDLRLSGGLNLLIRSRVPEAKGVSSSAAIEVAAMQAIAGALGVAIEPREMALLCQKVENLVVGAPCGVMDQMTSVCGEAGQLLELLCQPAELQGHAPLPEDLAVWGIDSGIRHSVSGADYGSVRIGAFMGYRMIAEAVGCATEIADGVARIEDGTWRGYAANIAPSEFEARFRSLLPDRMSGRAFLDRYGGTPDRVTEVDPDREYAVRVPTQHPVYEHHRVQAFAELLARDGDRRSALLGELMYQSHWSYTACGLGSGGTDRIVDLVQNAGIGSGLFGAKITGGGSGGTVAVLGRRDAGERVTEVAARYEEETGHTPYVFSGSGPGAAAFGTLRLGS